MELVYLGIVIFLFALSTFDLFVGVSNDAVNFLNSAIGAKVARFRTILIIASIGVFVGATMSNGMMDIARHGIFHPEFFTFEELMCVFLAVVASDVILLDIFNTLGMPTSTTVSMLSSSTMSRMSRTVFASGSCISSRRRTLTTCISSLPRVSSYTPRPTTPKPSNPIFIKSSPVLSVCAVIFGQCVKTDVSIPKTLAF